jgi:hypothetical protein
MEKINSRNLCHIKLPAVLLASTLAVSACSSSSQEKAVNDLPQPEPSPTQFVEGCEPYAVYSQNRFQPYGTAVRTEPSTLALKSDEIVFAPNEVIAVDGWTRTGVAAYPTNPYPINNDTNNDVWFHLANADAYVSFAGVRGAPTANDPTSTSSDLGLPLGELKPECEYQIDRK